MFALPELELNQIWHPDPAWRHNLLFDSISENGEKLLKNNKVGWYSSYYGIKEKTSYIIFSTKSNKIITKIKLGYKHQNIKIRCFDTQLNKRFLNLILSLGFIEGFTPCTFYKYKYIVYLTNYDLNNLDNAVLDKFIEDTLINAYKFKLNFDFYIKKDKKDLLQILLQSHFELKQTLEVLTNKQNENKLSEENKEWLEHIPHQIEKVEDKIYRPN